MDNPDDNPQLDIVAQRWPDVTLDEAANVLGSLSRPLQAQEIIAHSGRPTAAGSLVRTDRGNVFIKRYARSVRDADGILPYHRFVAHLAAHGIPTPPFLAFDAGRVLDRWAPAAGADSLRTGDMTGKPGVPAVNVRETTLTAGDVVYEVCAQASGEDRYVNALSWDPPETLGEAERLGEFVARIALASAGFDQPRSARPDPFQNRFGLFAAEDLDAALDQWLDDRPAVRGWIERHHRDVHRDIDLHRPFAERLAGKYQRLAPQWTHGDPHISNFLWSRDGDSLDAGRNAAGGHCAGDGHAAGNHAAGGYRPVSVFDFGLADRNTALFDLAELIERHAIQYVDIANGDDAACRPDIAAALVRGWNRVRPLSDLERELLPDLLVVCQAEAALNWIAYYVNGTGREEDALWCYDTSCIGHAAWFTRPDGRRFLDALRGTLDAL